MGTAHLTGTIVYIEADGEERTEVLDQTISFDYRVEFDLQEAGAGTKVISFGSIVHANLIYIEQLQGQAEVLLDGEVAGHKENVDGTTLLFNCDCSALSLKHADTIKSKVMVFGTL